MTPTRQGMAIRLVKVSSSTGVAAMHLSVQRSRLPRVGLPNGASSRSTMPMNTIKLLLLVVHLQLLVGVRRQTPLAEWQEHVWALIRVSLLTSAASSACTVLHRHDDGVPCSQSVIDFLNVLEGVRLRSVGSLDDLARQRR
jgi:hypothetical protein